MIYIREIIDRLGVKMNERFDIIYENTGAGIFNVYFTDNFDLKSDNAQYEDCLMGLYDVFTGEATIVKNPWKPCFDQLYYYVATDGEITLSFWSGSALDIALLYMKNCFMREEDITEENKRLLISLMKDTWSY